MPYDLAYEDGNRYAAIHSPATERANFIKKTYGHVAGAVFAFVGLEAFLFNSGFAEPIIRQMFSLPMAQLALMVLFIGGGYLAQALANSTNSKPLQYAGLGGYVVLEALIFLPLLWVAEHKTGNFNLAAEAGLITLAVFGALTVSVFVSGKDFSFMGSILSVLSFAALGVIAASVIFGFSLGLVFAAAMVVLAAGFIVYDTSNIMHRYGTDQYVGASLALFGSLAMMFWYVLTILLGSRSRD